MNPRLPLFASLFLLLGALAAESRAQTSADRPLRLVITEPAGAAGEYEASRAHFGGGITYSDVIGPARIVPVASPGDHPMQGCEPYLNASEVQGRIAFVERGGCIFVDKFRHAQAAGALAIVIYNALAPPGDDAQVIAMQGPDWGLEDITIGGLMITRAAGERLLGATGEVQGRILTGRDSVPAHEYAPIAIGNAWEYFASSSWEPEYNHYFRIDVTGDSLVGSDRYFRHRHETFSMQGTSIGTTYFLARYDTLTAMVVRFETGQPVPMTPALDAPPGAVMPPCPQIDFHCVTVSLVDGAKSIGSMFGGEYYRRGLGRTGEWQKAAMTTLRYARIDGVEWGEPPMFPLSTDAPAEVAVALSISAIYPNPFTDQLGVRLSVERPSEVRAVLVDLLGREVWRGEVQALPVGAHGLEVRAPGLPPGVYHLRITRQDGAGVVRRVVRL
jgi:hypothetical protein